MGKIKQSTTDKYSSTASRHQSWQGMERMPLCQPQEANTFPEARRCAYDIGPADEHEQREIQPSAFTNDVFSMRLIEGV